MDVQDGQGSPQSPSTEAITVSSEGANPSSTDLVNDYLGGQSHQQPAQQGANPETPQQPDSQQQPGQPEEQPGRAEQRINELTRQNYELQQRAYMADQLEMFIAANPQARAAYAQAIGQGATHEQAQQYAAQTQQQPQQQQQQAAKWYGDIPTDPNAIPEWDPFDPDTTREHAKLLVHDMVTDMMAPIMQQLQQFQPVMQQFQHFQQQQTQAEVQSTLGSVQEAIYNAIPTAKENQAHFTLAKGKLLEQIQTLPEPYQQAIYDYEYLNPKDRQIVGQVLNHCVQQASQQTNQLLAQLGGQPQPTAGQQQQRPFSEGATNLVAPRGNNATDITSMISAHLNRGH